MSSSSSLLASSKFHSRTSLMLIEPPPLPSVIRKTLPSDPKWKSSRAYPQSAHGNGTLFPHRENTPAVVLSYLYGKSTSATNTAAPPFDGTSPTATLR